MKNELSKWNLVETFHHRLAKNWRTTLIGLVPISLLLVNKFANLQLSEDTLIYVISLTVTLLGAYSHDVTVKD